MVELTDAITFFMGYILLAMPRNRPTHKGGRYFIWNRHVVPLACNRRDGTHRLAVTRVSVEGVGGVATHWPTMPQNVGTSQSGPTRFSGCSGISYSIVPLVIVDSAQSSARAILTWH